MNSQGNYDRLPQTGHGSSGENFRPDGSTTIPCGTKENEETVTNESKKGGEMQEMLL
jgi:hypothetical protein